MVHYLVVERLDKRQTVNTFVNAAIVTVNSTCGCTHKGVNVVLGKLNCTCIINLWLDEEHYVQENIYIL